MPTNQQKKNLFCQFIFDVFEQIFGCIMLANLLHVLKKCLPTYLMGPQIIMFENIEKICWTWCFCFFARLLEVGAHCWKRFPKCRLMLNTSLIHRLLALGSIIIRRKFLNTLRWTLVPSDFRRKVKQGKFNNFRYEHVGPFHFWLHYYNTPHRVGIKMSGQENIGRYIYLPTCTVVCTY